jgi:hypothetical protein
MYVIHNTTFQRMDSVSDFRWNLLSSAQYSYVVSASGHQQHHQLPPEAETSSIYWAQMSIFHLQTGTDIIHRNAVLIRRQDNG